ncbi:CxxC-x17-CxxC domain-containing protein [Patescibacteria group bacterium]
MYDKKEMFQATCSNCGQKCEVPFRPTGGKPVLCNNCFGQQKDKYQSRSDGRNQGRSGDRSFSRSGDRRMHTAVCDNCGQKAEVPFKPTGGKPIFCSDCFKKDDRQGDRRGGSRHSGRDRDSGGSNKLSEQMEALSNKLDKVISLLENGATKKKTEPKKAELKEKTAKKVARKKVKKVVGKKK